MDEKEAEILLEKSRNKIDEIDDNILRLIMERTSLSKDIIASKKALNKKLFDPTREKAIREKILKKLSDTEINKDKVLEIFDLLAQINKEIKKKYL